MSTPCHSRGTLAGFGGAGTFDGIFLTGIVAVLLANLSKRASDEGPISSNGWCSLWVSK